MTGHKSITEAEYDEIALRIAFSSLLRQLRFAHPDCFTANGSVIASRFMDWLVHSEMPRGESAEHVLDHLVRR